MFDRITPVNKGLILANLIVFGLQYLLGGLVEVPQGYESKGDNCASLGAGITTTSRMTA